MAIVGNKLLRKEQQKQEESVNFDQQILRMEDDIRKLKIEFDMYFGGALKRPPLATRARIDSNIKRLADDRHLTFAQRFQLNTLISRFTSYRELWRRLLKLKGEELV